MSRIRSTSSRGLQALALLVMLAFANAGLGETVAHSVVLKAPGDLSLTTETTYNSRYGNNVFTTASPVSLRLATPGGPYTLEDSIGTTKTLSAEGDKLEFGKLGAGFYTLKGADEEAVCSFAVVPASYGNSEDTAFCLDMALAWNKSPNGEEYRTWYPRIIGSLALAGMRSARERSSTIGSDSSFDLTTPPDTRRAVEKLEFLYRVYKQQKVRVITVYHNVPGWTRSAMASVPRDLTDIYKMQTAYSSHFKNDISAWEIWNENDLHEFYKGTAYHYAALLKTAYLASKKAVPETHVSLSSIALGPGSMSDAIFANGINPYFDAYNYHTYARATEHARLAGDRVDYFFKRGGARPIWKTETGVTLRDREHYDRTGEYTPKDMKRAGNFFVRSMVNTTSMGIDRTYWFLGAPGKRWPHMGLIAPNENATRLLSVFATMNKVLQDGNYAGSYTPKKDLHVHVYNTTGGQAAALWSNGGAGTVMLPVEGDATVYAMSGEVVSEHRGVRDVTVAIEDEPVFIAATSFRLNLKPRNPALTAAPKSTMATPSRIVIDPSFEEEHVAYDTHQHMLSIAPGRKIKGSVKIYNFSDTPYRGSLDVQLSDPAWGVHLDSKALAIDPMSRVAVPFTLQAPEAVKGFEVSTLDMTTDSGRSVSQVRLGIDRRTLPPRSSLDLTEGMTWRLNFNRNVADAKMSVVDAKRQISFISKTPGNSWLRLDMNQNGGFDLAGYDAIKVTLNVTKVATPGVLDVRCHEPNGAFYGMMRHPLKEGELVLWNFFSDLRWVPSSKRDGPDFHLDTSNITKLQFLLGPRNKEIEHEYAFEVEAIEAVKW